jgi:rhodanese-related sulfurtransferase
MQLNINEIEAVELAEWVSNDEKKFHIIDVREMQEIQAGTIPGASPMPMASIPLRTSELNTDEPVVFVCRSGARSAQVCAFLQQQGFSNVINLRGGMFAWAGAGQPVGLPGAS